MHSVVANLSSELVNQSLSERRGKTLLSKVSMRGERLDRTQQTLISSHRWIVHKESST